MEGQEPRDRKEKRGLEETIKGMPVSSDPGHPARSTGHRLANVGPSTMTVLLQPGLLPLRFPRPGEQDRLDPGDGYQTGRPSEESMVGVLTLLLRKAWAERGFCQTEKPSETPTALTTPTLRQWNGKRERTKATERAK